MVLKGTKRSLRTGNTLRNTGDRQTNKRASGMIVRHVTHGKGRQLSYDEADDAHLTADGVAFSLNKKGRWNLPEVIEENIVHSDTGAAAVSLLRRHRLKRQNDCVGVVARTDDSCHAVLTTTAQFSAQRKKARRKTYCNGLNVLHNGRGKSTKETRKKKVVSTKKDLAQRKQTPTEDPDQENNEAAPEVRYDVFYPVPATSSVLFHQNLTVPTNLKSSKVCYQRCKYVDYDFYDDDDFYDDWVYHEEDYGDELYADLPTEAGREEPETDAFSDSLFLFSDFVEQAFEASLLCSTPSADRTRNPRKKGLKKKRGGPFFYRPEAEDEADSCLEDSRSEFSSESESSLSAPSPTPSVIRLTELPWVTAQLARAAMDAERLSERYGPRYSEADCLPRKVVLDISGEVQSAVSRLPAFSAVFLPKLELTSYLLLTYICPVSRDQGCEQGSDEGESSLSRGQEYDVYHVQLNTNCALGGLTLRLQDRATFDSVDEVVQQALGCLDSLSPEVVARHPSQALASALKTRLAPSFSTLAEVNGWRTTCLSLLDQQGTLSLPPASSFLSLQSTDENGPDDSHNPSADETSEEKVSRDIAEDRQLATTQETFCHICFSEIQPSSPTGPHGTALTRCGHWFCDACWQSHVAMSLQEGACERGLQCPEFGCHVQVDTATLLSVRHVRDVMEQRRRQVEGWVTRGVVCKWCPNPHCGRLVQLPASSSHMDEAQPTSMACPCGQRFCFRCHGDPHWPLSCSQLPLYHSLLRQHGHMTPPAADLQGQVVVRGKACPSCRRFIEKNGGCPYMTCVCGHHFWWCCRKSVKEAHKCANISSRVLDTYNTTSRVIRHEPKRLDVESEWYELAVQHRRLQQPGRVKLDHRRAEKLRRRLQELCARGADVRVNVEPLPETSPAPKLASSSSEQSPSEAQVESESRVLCRAVPKGKCRSGARTSRRREDGVSPTHGSVEGRVRQVQEAVRDMLALKLELHSVLENTAALLHLRLSAPTAADGKVKDAVHCLQFLLASLDGLLGAADNGLDLCQVLLWFRRLQRNVKGTLTTLAHVVSR